MYNFATLPSWDGGWKLILTPGSFVDTKKDKPELQGTGTPFVWQLTHKQGNMGVPLPRGLRCQGSECWDELLHCPVCGGLGLITEVWLCSERPAVRRRGASTSPLPKTRGPPADKEICGEQSIFSTSSSSEEKHNSEVNRDLKVVFVWSHCTAGAGQPWTTESICFITFVIAQAKSSHVQSTISLCRFTKNASWPILSLYVAVNGRTEISELPCQRASWRPFTAKLRKSNMADAPTGWLLGCIQRLPPSSYETTTRDVARTVIGTQARKKIEMMKMLTDRKHVQRSALDCFDRPNSRIQSFCSEVLHLFHDWPLPSHPVKQIATRFFCNER